MPNTVDTKSSACPRGFEELRKKCLEVELKPGQSLVQQIEQAARLDSMTCDESMYVLRQSLHKRGNLLQKQRTQPGQENRAGEQPAERKECGRRRAWDVPAELNARDQRVRYVSQNQRSQERSENCPKRVDQP